MKKVILFMWFGDEKPPYIQWTLDNFRKMNPGWEIRYIEYSTNQILNYKETNDTTLASVMKNYEQNGRPFDYHAMDAYRFTYLNSHKDELIVYCDLDCFPIAPFDDFIMQESEIPQWATFAVNGKSDTQPIGSYAESVAGKNIFRKDIWCIANTNLVSSDRFIQMHKGAVPDKTLMMCGGMVLNSSSIDLYKKRNNDFHEMKIELGDNFCLPQFTPIEHYRSLEWMKLNRGIMDSNKTKHRQEARAIPKVSILNKTFVHQENNYGQRLQCYALQTFIQRTLGYVVHTWDDRKWWCADIRTAFDEFEKTHMNFADTPIQDIYDTTLVGSDQVWNRNWTSWTKTFYSTDNKGVRLVSYAASAAGTMADRTNKGCMDWQMESLSKFDALSFREKLDADEFTKDASSMGLKAKIDFHIDPVFLLTLDEWKSIMRRPSFVQKGEKFKFRYLFGDKPNEKTNENGLPTYTVYVDNKSFLDGWKDIPQPSPEEFLWLVANCETFETWSFHGTLFGLMFDKKFAYVCKDNVRIKNVLNMLGVKFKGNKVENYEEMMQNVVRERARSLDWLKGILSCDGLMYACRLKNGATKDRCASGGASAALAQTVIDRGGVVYGAAYSEDFRTVVSIPVDNMDNYFKRIAKSKYNYCQMPDIEGMRAHLNNGRLVLFTGCPCQVKKLKKSLGRDYENLVCVDLMCNGYSRPELLRNFIDEQEKLEQSKVVSLDMRPEHKQFSRIAFENGKSKDIWNVYGNFVCNKDKYQSECGECAIHPLATHSTHRQTSADLTIGDLWTYKAYGLGDDWKPEFGSSVVVVNNERGRGLLAIARPLMEIELLRR